MDSTSSTGKLVRSIGVALQGAAVAAVLFAAAPPAQAQDMPVAISAGLDVPSLYYFRGFRQESHPKLTLWPWVDVGIPIKSEGDGSLESVGLNVGLWNSAHTGSSGSDIDGQGMLYETDFYATLGLGFASGVSLGTTYTAYTSPNDSFDRVHEIAFKVSTSSMLAPYGMVAFEFAEDDPGSYLELGIGPSLPLGEEGGPTLTVPVKVGLGLKDYYDDGASFGFFSVGGTVSYPINEMVSVKGGLEVLTLGEGAEALNADFTEPDFETSKVGFVVFGGIGFAF